MNAAALGERCSPVNADALEVGRSEGAGGERVRGGAAREEIAHEQNRRGVVSTGLDETCRAAVCDDLRVANRERSSCQRVGANRAGTRSYVERVIRLVRAAALDI